MHTLKSPMSVVEYTCAFHRTTTTKSSKSPSYDKFISFSKNDQHRHFSKQGNSFKFENLHSNLNQSYKHEHRSLTNYQAFSSKISLSSYRKSHVPISHNSTRKSSLTRSRHCTNFTCFV